MHEGFSFDGPELCVSLIFSSGNKAIHLIPLRCHIRWLVKLSTRLLHQLPTQHVGWLAGLWYTSTRPVPPWDAVNELVWSRNKFFFKYLVGVVPPVSENNIKTDYGNLPVQHRHHRPPVATHLENKSDKFVDLQYANSSMPTNRLARINELSVSVLFWSNPGILADLLLLDNENK